MVKGMLKLTLEETKSRPMYRRKRTQQVLADDRAHYLTRFIVDEIFLPLQRRETIVTLCHILSSDELIHAPAFHWFHLLPIHQRCRVVMIRG